ncbi:MAG: carbohydrate porin [Sulfurifustaceae bacterium]
MFFGAFALGCAAAAAEPTETQKELQELRRRVEKLESRNAELERALESERVSETEPELVTRLKAVEFQALGMQKQARTIESLEGINVGVSFTTTAQAVNRAATTDNTGESELNYRVDVAVSLPGGEISNAEGKIFGQIRLGQGLGVTGLRPTFSSPNATTFQLSGVSSAEDSDALLAQAWYQLDVPLPAGGYKPQSREKLTINFGKIDPFVFFDQNAAANDETRQFINNVFVHNALLDAGRDTGADAHGFQPGLRMAYVSEKQKPLTYGLSLGIFGAGKGAHFENSLRSPFAILQADTHRKFFRGLDGNYRVYLWRNGQATPFNNPFDTATERHAGWGLSADQRVGDTVMLFARYGKETRGRVQFDRVTSLGAEWGGDCWNRAADSVGVAFGRLRSSDAFRVDAPTLDADADSAPDFGYAPDTAEEVIELYYRYRVHKQFELSPDAQWIRNPGGSSTAADAKLIGLRAQVTF